MLCTTSVDLLAHFFLGFRAIISFKIPCLAPIFGTFALYSRSSSYSHSWATIPSCGYQLSQVTFNGFNCVRPQSPATALGIVAVLAIILAQIIISVATGCICCCCKRGSHPNSSNWIKAQICFVFSWITVVIAAIVLLLASSYNTYNSTVRCYVTKPGVFAAGAILCLASVALGLASYILSLQKTSNNLFQGGIAMAQPQFAGGTGTYQGATPIGQPQYQWGTPAVPNQGEMPMGHAKFPQ